MPTVVIDYFRLFYGAVTLRKRAGINNFSDMFGDIKKKAGIKSGTFHDLRRTAITNWFYEGLEITEVMRLAGHSKYDTTLRYYLAVKDDLVDRARRAVIYWPPERVRHLIGYGL